MCDTLVAPPSCTRDQNMLFAKNSDRQRNEAQAIEFFPRARHVQGTTVKCTYVAVEQVPHTHAVLLCRPYWMWGAEMGANEHGVAIGNEGLQARGDAPKEEALIGMDLIRLTLERAATAAEAVNVITTLLERHGQGGNCGHLTPSYYHNGFLIADPVEAFVLETAGREWLVESVRGVHAISNAYSIGRKAQRVSNGLAALVRASGWSEEAERDYAEALADPHRQHIGTAGARRACSISLMSSRSGRLAVLDMMGILRDHGFGDRYHPEWRADCAMTQTLCMHAGAEDRPAQTVGSMVSDLHRGTSVHWVTGTAAPCISIFKPVLLDVPLPSRGTTPTDRFDPNSLWWLHERMHRMALMDGFQKFLESIRPERDELEVVFVSRIEAVRNGGGPVERSAAVAECWREALETEQRWLGALHQATEEDNSANHAAWASLNRVARMPEA